MKGQIMSGVAMLSLTLAPAGAYAQLAHRVEAVVPFEFTVSGKLLPDGKYIVTRDTSSFLKIESLDGSTAELALAQYVRSKTPNKEATLVFERISGEHYFLSQIWEPGNDAGIEVPRCKAERELIKQVLASSSPNRERSAGPELVYVTGRLANF
jgi:hypothetical protein